MFSVDPNTSFQTLPSLKSVFKYMHIYIYIYILYYILYIYVHIYINIYIITYILKIEHSSVEIQSFVKEYVHI